MDFIVRKRYVAMLLSVVMFCTLFFFVKEDSYAMEMGTTKATAVSVQMGKKYYKNWTNDNLSLNCFYKFKMNKRGVLTITSNKPEDEMGALGHFVFNIYSKTGKLVWSGDSHEQSEIPTNNYSFKVGLAKGDYYLNVDAYISFYSEGSYVESWIKLSQKANSYFEVEGNNSKSSATKLKLNKYYGAVYCEESSSTNHMDYFKVKLTKGKKYKFVVKNYDELFSDTAYLNIYDPSGKNITGGNDLYFDIREKGKATYKAKKSGYYYIKLYNDGFSIPVNYKIGVYKK